MNPQIKEILDQLRGINLPNSIGFEIAYGWYVLLIAALLILVIIFYLKKKPTAIKKLVFNELYLIEEKYNKDNDNLQLAITCNLLLRRYFKQKKITFNKQDFLETLAQKQQMSNEIIEILSKKIYQNDKNFDAKPLLDYCGELIYAIENNDA